MPACGFGLPPLAGCMLFSEKMNLLKCVSLFFSFSLSADHSHSSQVHKVPSRWRTRRAATSTRCTTFDCCHDVDLLPCPGEGGKPRQVCAQCGAEHDRTAVEFERVHALERAATQQDLRCA